MKLSIIIPYYNEERTISKILDKILAVNLGKIKKEIILIDDGSKDSTTEIIKKKRIKDLILIQNKKNQGKGYSIRIGLKKVTGDLVIIQDADLEYEPSDYPKLIQPILDKKTNVVYGSRRLKHNKNKKYILNWHGTTILTMLTNLLYNANITDEATCYKVFKTNLIKNINLKCKRFEFCPEITAKIRKKRQKILEIPIEYNPRSFEEGKKINWKDGFEAVWTLIKYRFID